MLVQLFQKSSTFQDGLKLYYYVHNSLPLVPVGCLLNPVHNVPSCLFEICCNIILPHIHRSLKWSPSSTLSHHNPACILFSPVRATHPRAHSPRPPSFDHCNTSLVRDKRHEAPHYTVFSNILLLSPSLVQILFSASCSRTPCTYVLLLALQTTFLTHTKQQSTLQFCMI